MIAAETAEWNLTDTKLSSDTIFSITAVGLLCRIASRSNHYASLLLSDQHSGGTVPCPSDTMYSFFIAQCVRILCH